MGDDEHSAGAPRSRTTHLVSRPIDPAEQRLRSRTTTRNLVVHLVGLGVLALVVAVLCSAWSLTAHTVTGRVVSCGPPHHASRGGSHQSCRVEWTRGGRTSVGTVTFAAPAPVGQQRQLSVHGLGTQAVRRMEHLGWFGLGFALFGSGALIGARFLRRFLR